MKIKGQYRITAKTIGGHVSHVGAVVSNGHWLVRAKDVRNAHQFVTKEAVEAAFEAGGSYYRQEVVAVDGIDALLEKVLRGTVGGQKTGRLLEPTGLIAAKSKESSEPWAAIVRVKGGGPLIGMALEYYQLFEMATATLVVIGLPENPMVVVVDPAVEKQAGPDGTVTVEIGQVRVVAMPVRMGDMPAPQFAMPGEHSLFSWVA